MLHLVLLCALRLFLFGRGNYISGKRRRGENPRGFRRLAPEMGKEPEEKRKSSAEDKTGDDGEIERGVFTTMDDVAGEFVESEGEFGPEVVVIAVAGLTAAGVALLWRGSGKGSGRGVESPDRQ